MTTPILTLLGGTVGGYITFAGAHRLIDAGVTGKENLGQIKKSSVTGMLVATLVRVLLFLAVLGVVVTGADILSGANPAAEAFRQGAGEIGYRFAGLVILAAAITSIIGAAYTSVSFLKTFHTSIADHENWWVIGFIALSTLIMVISGSPATLLVVAGALNVLILPLSLGISLVAAKSTKIVGQNYKHPTWLLVLGIIVVVLSAYVGIKSLGNLGTLFH
jgi:Mn2+/Fe2+ NRAMP family transporter